MLLSSKIRPLFNYSRYNLGDYTVGSKKLSYSSFIPQSGSISCSAIKKVAYNGEQKNWFKSRNPERVLLRIPKKLWLLKRGLAFCAPRNSIINLFGILAIAGSCFFMLDFYVKVPFIPIIIHAIAWSIACIFLILLALPTIFIRKDCFECQLGFHIIAHERNHLLLNSLDEALVEEEALKQTGDKLIPILLSNPELCKDCAFPLRKIYAQATSKYLKEKKKGEKQ